MSFSAISAEIPVASQTGTITVKGSVYTSACSVSGADSVNVVIPSTYAQDYTGIGDTSPLGKSSTMLINCSGNANMTGIYLTVEGDPDDSDPSLFKIASGTGKAAGVALKVQATPVVVGSTVASIPLAPNKESTTTVPNRTGVMPMFQWTFDAQAVAVADTVKSGDLDTTLTWTARYN
ncbi:hypothetical protein G163CM_20310 [Pseudocitrobacter corydidari]|uniref:Fimbrial-type adhesion domain-containing protein n=2 Tax=Pseudocitrobacter corydidari TaxID=2891570 RepID=A0ABY3S5G8_9ENTR|nr:hypothetical protein G163CM_20310 [Pseudocitrobacter corydidari]